MNSRAWPVGELRLHPPARWFGTIDFMQGLIALFKDEYYVVTQSHFLVVNLTAWS